MPKKKKVLIPAEPAPAKGVMAAKVDTELWARFRRTIWARRAKGETVDIGAAVEAALRDYLDRRGGGYGWLVWQLWRRRGED